MKKIDVPVFLFLTLALISALAGCGGGLSKSAAYSEADAAQAAGYNEYSKSSYEGAGFNQESPMESQAQAVNDGQVPSGRAASNAPNVNAAAVARKLVKRAEVSIEADRSLVDSEGRLAGVDKKVRELLARYKAYSERTDSDEHSASYTIRVPQVSYEALLSDAGVLGKVRSRTESAEDVTLKYYDMEGRLATKKTLLATFQGYLGRTKDIDDIMKVETRIADLQNEIDWLGTQLTQLSNLVDYATVHLSIYSAGYQPKYTLGDRIRDIFVPFGGFLSGLVTVLVGIVIYGIPIIVLCLFAVWLFFGRVGLLKKVFRLVMGGKYTAAVPKIHKETTLDRITEEKE